MQASDPDPAAFDHVILATPDAEATAARLRRDHGLGAVRGGSHPWGTANWIVPLQPPTYLEILYPEDPDRHAADPEGAELLHRMRRGEFWAGWAVRPTSIERLARRLGIELSPGRVTRPDGSVSSWRTAEMKSDLEGALPFFIDYDHPADRLERFAASYEAAGHDRRVGSVAWIEVVVDPSSDEARILGSLVPDIQIRTVEGSTPGLRAVCLRVDDEVVELRAGAKLSDP